MTQFANLFSGRQFLDSNGNPYVGAKLFSYTAGTSTKATLTRDEAGTSNHTNPIILNARGEPADAGGSSQAMWQTSGVSIKLVLAPSTDTDPPLSAISTWDNLDGINDGSLISDQWIAGPAPTYISSTSFSLVGDKTTDFHVGRRLKTTNTAGTIYSTITAAAFTTLTTVTVVNDSGVLDSGLSAVRYGLISATNNSVPGGTHEAMTFWTQGIGPNYLQNIGIAASVASKALTVSITTKLGTVTTATDYAQISFRHSTLTTGLYVTRNKTTDGPVVAPSTATLGFTASQTGYVYVYALDNAGAVETIISGSNHWDEGALQSTTAISTAADSGSVLYSTTARTNVPIRYIGRMKIQTGAVAGEWDNEDTEIHVGPTNNAAADQGLTAASGTTTNIWNGGKSKHISGTTTITSFGTALYAGQEIHCIADGAFILTHGANLNLPGAANITTAAGDHFNVYADTTTQLDIRNYTRANGAPLSIFTSGTVIATTSGTTHTFSGLPAGIKEIKFILSDVSTNGTSYLRLQIGDSGGIENSGYIASAEATASTADYPITTAVVAADTYSGIITIALVDSATNTWISSGVVRSSAAVSHVSGGSKSLTGVLDRILISGDGVNTFDAGKIQIIY